MDLQLTISLNSAAPVRPDSQTKPEPQIQSAPQKARETGKVVPVEGKKKPPKPPKLQQAIQQIKNFLSESQRRLQFRVDEQSGRTVITVINPQTREIIRQIPEDQVLRLAAEMQQRGPGFISEIV